MKKTNASATAKKTTATKKSNVIAKVTKINLSKFTDALKNVEVSEKRTKETIYVYPEGMTENEKSGEKGKKFRNKLRNQMKRFANNIFVHAKTNSPVELQKEIDLFDAFYKINYRTNDYSFASISNTKNEGKEKDLKLMLEIINEVKNSK